MPALLINRQLVSVFCLRCASSFCCTLLSLLSVFLVQCARLDQVTTIERMSEDFGAEVELLSLKLLFQEVIGHEGTLGPPQAVRRSYEGKLSITSSHQNHVFWLRV